MAEDERAFQDEVGTVCALYAQAQTLQAQGIHVVSVDEQTGIQALERLHPAHPMRPDRPERLEFEYQRHGTQALIANFEAASGKVVSSTAQETRNQETRNEADFVAHIHQTVAIAPQGQWIFIADQLHTHKSATLVEWVGEQCGIKAGLGVKGESGILYNMASRAAFLQDENHRIRFIYTPKHRSWLNQVEIWFGILSRRLLKRGSFKSTAELKTHILQFIDFFNETLGVCRTFHPQSG